MNKILRGITITPEDARAFLDSMFLLQFPSYILTENRKFKAFEFARKITNKSEIEKLIESWK